MSKLDDSFRTLASVKIAQYGTTVTLTTKTTGVYDQATGSPAVASKAYKLMALVSEYSGAALAAGLVQVGDKKFTLAAKDTVAPQPGDSITLNGVVYIVVTVRETWSGEKVVVYEVQGRK